MAQVYAGNEVGNAVAINGDLILPSYATVVQCVVGEATTEVKAANARWTCKTLNVPDRDIVDNSFDMIFPAAAFFEATPATVGKLMATEVKKGLTAFGMSSSDMATLGTAPKLKVHLMWRELERAFATHHAEHARSEGSHPRSTHCRPPTAGLPSAKRAAPGDPAATPQAPTAAIAAAASLANGRAKRPKASATGPPPATPPRSRAHSRGVHSEPAR